jgi:hypothetical protein
MPKYQLKTVGTEACHDEKSQIEKLRYGDGSSKTCGLI